MTFDAFAVTTPSGPHVTMQAGVVHVGRYWTTAPRDSLKARMIRRNRSAAVTTVDDQHWRVFGGPATVLDARHPSTLAADPFASTLAGGALLRLGFGRLDQLLGYAEVGIAIPSSFLPAGRVLLLARITDRLEGDGSDIVSAAGRWSARRRLLEPNGWRPFSATGSDDSLAHLAPAVADLAHRPGPAWLGIEADGGPASLPGQWDPDTGAIEVGRHPLSALAAELPGPACITIDESSSRRPDGKVGVMLRGWAGLVEVDQSRARVRIDVRRVTSWTGFTSTTFDEAA